jgi:hypothetical protein
MSEAIDRARAAIRVWDQPTDDDNDDWAEIGPLRAALDGLTEEDAVVLMDEAKERLGVGDDHHVVDEIVATFLPPLVRERYQALRDGKSWFYA